MKRAPAANGKDFLRIEWESDELRKDCRQWEKQIRAMPDEDRELWIRAPEQALRIATDAGGLGGWRVS
jgi:hypothetical protein